MDADDFFVKVYLICVGIGIALIIAGILAILLRPAALSEERKCFDWQYNYEACDKPMQ